MFNKQYAGGGDWDQMQQTIEIPPIEINLPKPDKSQNYGFEILMALIVSVLAPIIVMKLTKSKGKK